MNIFYKLLFNHVSKNDTIFIKFYFIIIESNCILKNFKE